MIKVENITYHGWEEAIRGMRNPMNSWVKSDSCTRGPVWCNEFCGKPARGCDGESGFNLGPNDYDLMNRLRNAGRDHRKFMRMITVYMDIIAPLYWWKEFDTYKVGTVANSCSTMHKIAAKEFTLEDFSHEHLEDSEIHILILLDRIINILNFARDMYLETKSKEWWWHMIQLLPSSYNQRRTVMLNYEVLANIYKSRKAHKLDEWREFCKIIIEKLPYSELITGE